MGAVPYPTPPSLITNLSTPLLVVSIEQVAAAPVPPPPLIEIVGATVYWIYSRNKDIDKDNDGYVDETKPQQLSESER